jgi:hypothetical protein
LQPAKKEKKKEEKINLKSAMREKNQCICKNSMHLSPMNVNEQDVDVERPRTATTSSSNAEGSERTAER